jgi:hypothetical protein
VRNQSPSQQQNQRPSRAVKVLLLVVLAALVSRHLLALLPDPTASFAWYITDSLRPIGMAAALAICATLTPWRSLRLKCLLAALCGYYISDAVVCITWYAWQFPSPISMVVIQGVGALSAFLYYWRRSYGQPSDELACGYLYCVRHIPTSAQDFLISMSGCFGPDGGYSLCANGYLYKFSSGRLVRRKVSSLPSISYHVQRGGKASQELIEGLDALIGTKWTWRNNCLTILAPIWRHHRG